MSSITDLARRSLQLALQNLGKNQHAPMIGWVLADNHLRIISEGWLPKKPILSNTIFYGNTSDQPVVEKSLFLNAVPDFLPELLEILQYFSIKKIYLAGAVNEEKKSFLSDAATITDALLPDEEAFLNRRYYTSQTKKKPYIILKWAETADGFVARKNYDSKWISNAYSRRLVHKWRKEEDAILVATNTAQYDNPQLNVRDWTGRNPLRIVIDKQLRLNKNLHLFDQSQPTICYNQMLQKKENNNEWVKITEEDNLTFFSSLLRDLYDRKIQSILIEGGSLLLQFLLQNGIWDEARVFRAPVFFLEGIPTPKIKDASVSSVSEIDNDQLTIYQKLNRK